MPLSDPNHPTLLGGCGRAATAAEARYRINAPVLSLRSTRIVALDGQAEAIVRDIASQNGGGPQFYAYQPVTGRANDDLMLRSVGGTDTPLSSLLVSAYAVVLLATTGDGAPAATTIGETCFRQGITVAGVVVGGAGDETAAAVTALRPHARILLTLDDAADVFEVLGALRA
jgi:hypothetical protein